MEQEFIKTLNEQGLYAAVQNHKIDESFFVSNLAKIGDNYLLWNAIFQHQELSDGFLRSLIKKGKMSIGVGNQNFVVISSYQKLTEEFLEDFKDELDWFFISIKQELSEHQMEKYEDKLDWWLLSQWQNMSSEFIEKHRDKLDEEQLKRNKFVQLK